MYTVNFVSVVFFSTVVSLELLCLVVNHRRDIIDKAARLDRLLKLFKHSNVLPSLMSLKDGKSNSTTYFDAYCDHILDAIHKHGWSGKQKYFDTFTLKNGRK